MKYPFLPGSPADMYFVIPACCSGRLTLFFLEDSMPAFRICIFERLRNYPTVFEYLVFSSVLALKNPELIRFIRVMKFILFSFTRSEHLIHPAVMNRKITDCIWLSCSLMHKRATVFCCADFISVKLRNPVQRGCHVQADEDLSHVLPVLGAGGKELPHQVEIVRADHVVVIRKFLQMLRISAIIVRRPLRTIMAASNTAILVFC